MNRVRTIAIVLALAAVGCTPKGAKVELNVRQIVVNDSVLVAHGADTVDFGLLHEGETAVQELAIVNGADRPMVVIGTETSCGCLEAKYDKHPAAPGESLALKLEFHSAGQRGVHHKPLYVQTSLAPERYRIIIQADVR